MTSKQAAVAMLMAWWPLLGVAQTPFAGEDFDGGATNGGFVAQARSYSPDLSGSSPIRSSFNGLDRFDRFGEISRLDLGQNGVEGLPFNLADDSLSISPADRVGFVAETKTDDFFVVTDTVNPTTDHMGAVSASWTFDIAGHSNIGLSIDFGMIGDFEIADRFDFSYSIDGGPFLPAFQIHGVSDVLYSFTMDNGVVVDRLTDLQFNSQHWQSLVTTGPSPGLFSFHSLDTGTNGDSMGQDGFIPVTFDGGSEDVRAYFRALNDVAEYFPSKDPLAISSGDGMLITEQLATDFTTYTTSLVGEGALLVLRLDAEADGTDEYFAFDNIVLFQQVPEPSAFVLVTAMLAAIAGRRR